MKKKCNWSFLILILFCTTLMTHHQNAFAKKENLNLSETTEVTTVDTQQLWTLQDALERMFEVSPQIRANEAEVMARKSDLSQAGAWPNPEVEIGGSEKLGIDDGSGGVDLTQVVVSQPVSLGRLEKQRTLADANYKIARQNLIFQQLAQEAEAAQHFHLLQLMTAKLELSEEQLTFAKRYQKSDSNNRTKEDDPLVRYLSPLEQKRLDIMKAFAVQAVANAEGKYSEALSGFKGLLQLPDSDLPKLEMSKPVEFEQTLDDLLALQEQNHPVIIMAKLKEDVAKVGIMLARGELFPDPIVKIFGEKDILDGMRETFYGASISLQLPFWDRKSGAIAKSKFESEKISYELQIERYRAQNQLKQNFLHLSHLKEQTEQYHAEILGPAKEVFELTKRAFASGEVNVLSIIDANNTYFDSLSRYQELLYESWIELTELRLSAGIFLVGHQSFENNSLGGKP